MITKLHFFFISALAISNVFASPIEGVPALSIVAPNGQTSILIGTVHVGIEGVRQPGPSIFKNAKRFVIEHHGKLQPGDEGSAPGKDRAEWAKNLTDEEITVYLSRARCAHKKDADALSYLSRPSDQLANQLAYQICNQKLTLPRDFILIYAMAIGLRVDTLEEDAWVEEKRRSVPTHVGDAGFKWALSHDPKTVLSGIKDAMNRGDYESVRQQHGASLGNADDAAIQQRIMIDERSAAWMPKLRHYLDDGQAVIMVGAGHLPGPKGLINLLQSSGYAVRPITLPEQ